MIKQLFESGIVELVNISFGGYGCWWKKERQYLTFVLLVVSCYALLQYTLSSQYSLIRYRFHSGPKSVFRFFENAHVGSHFRVNERRVEPDVDFAPSDCLNWCRTTSVHTCWVPEKYQLGLLKCQLSCCMPIIILTVPEIEVWRLDRLIKSWSPKNPAQS